MSVHSALWDVYEIEMDLTHRAEVFGPPSERALMQLSLKKVQNPANMHLRSSFSCLRLLGKYLRGSASFRDSFLPFFTLDRSLFPTLDLRSLSKKFNGKLPSRIPPPESSPRFFRV